jgi:hypothetical protein
MRFGEPPTSGNTSVHNGRKTTSGQVLHAGRPMFLVRYALDEPDNALRVMNLRVARTVFPITHHMPSCSAQSKDTPYCCEVNTGR